LSNPVKSRDFAVLYRERIYYPADAEERKMLMEEPSKYVKDHSMPLDIDYCPKICLLGLMKSGKTELAKTLSQNTKCVHLNMDEIVQ
jgi:predicted AAA+ superfamily ATPase